VSAANGVGVGTGPRRRAGIIVRREQSFAPRTQWDPPRLTRNFPVSGYQRTFSVTTHERSVLVCLGAVRLLCDRRRPASCGRGAALGQHDGSQRAAAPTTVACELNVSAVAVAAPSAPAAATTTAAGATRWAAARPRQAAGTASTKAELATSW